MKKITLLLCSCLIAAALQAQIIQVPGVNNLTIQQGIELANPGDTVLVSDEVYYEQINFLGKKPLTVASWFIIDGDTSHISNTIIDGSQISDPDSASVVYFISGEDSTSILCGFTIQGGKGTIDYFPSVVGGGIYVRNSGATIRNNIVANNHLIDPDFPGCLGIDGGGIFIDNSSDSWCILENNEISDNSITSFNTECGSGGIGAISNARIRNNLIKGNSCIQNLTDTVAYLYAGGLFFDSYPTYPLNELILLDNIFESNSLVGLDGAGAGAYLKNGKVTCTGNEFIGNKIADQTIWGGGGALFEALAEGSIISGNIFRNNEVSNRGGAIFIGWNQNWVVIENNYFFNNSAYSGGAVSFHYSKLTLQNNVFYNNEAGLSGGAIFLNGDDNPYEHSACIINNSFSENSAASTGGAITANFVNPIILNSVFWHDTANYGPEIRGGCYFIEIAYCNVDTNMIFNPNNDIIIGEGIINEDPLFIDTTLLNISMLSPCMDAGIAEYTCHNYTWKAPAYDIDGIPRPQSGGFEMGAYEVLIPGVSPVGGQQSAVSGQRLTVRTYPNPTGGIVNLQFTVYNLQYMTLKLYDLYGREVATVLDQQIPEGEHTVRFDASGLSAGVYFYRLAVGGQRSAVSGKMVKY